MVAESCSSQERLWETRRAIIDALKSRSPINHTGEIVVPRARIRDFLREMRELQGKYECPIICFGHAGDGNVHVNILKDERTGSESGRQVVQSKKADGQEEPLPG